VEVVAPTSMPLPLPIVLPPLTVAAGGQRSAPTGLKVEQLGLATWNLDRIDQRVCYPCIIESESSHLNASFQVDALLQCLPPGKLNCIDTVPRAAAAAHSDAHPACASPVKTFLFAGGAPSLRALS